MPAFIAPVRINSANTADAFADALFAAGTASRKPLVVQGKVGQTANLQEWQAQNGAVSAFIAPGGSASFGGNVAISGTAVSADIGVISAQNVNDPATAKYGAQFNRTLVLSATNAQQVLGGSFQTTTAGSAFNPTGILRGVQGTFQHGTTATVTTGRGVEGLVYNTTTGIISAGSALHGTVQNLNATGVISNAYGVRVEVAFNTGTITNTYGLYVGDITAGTQTNQAYGLYVSDTGARNFFAGQVELGDAANFVFGTTTGTKIGSAANQKIGKWGVTPIVQPSGWGTPTGTLTRTAFDPSTATLVDVAQRVAALITDLKATGEVGA